MGGMNSIHQKLKEFSDTEDNNDTDSEMSTPQREFKAKCMIGIDPRSPTEDINRTPIIVNGTPITHHLSKDIKSKITTMAHQPKAEQAFDPRSPTVDFTRTPLSLSSNASSSNSDTPLKAPTLAANKPFAAKISAEEKLFDLLDKGSPSSDSSLTDDSFDTAPLLLESTEKLSVGGLAKKSSLSSDQDVGTDDSFSSQSKLRCRPVNRILSQYTPTIVKPRSPLTSVDNSQRTSSVSSSKKPLTSSSSGNKSLGSYVNPNANSGSAVDKENLCH